MNALLALRRRLLSLADRASPLGPLLARLSLFAVFAPSGWGKLHDLEKVTAFFTDLGIPAPAFNAVLVATTELVGGSLLLVGLGARLAAAPLGFSMIIAILTAKRDELTGIIDLLSVSEFVYITLLAWLALSGPGRLSVDRLIARAIDRSAPSVDASSTEPVQGSGAGLAGRPT